MSDQDLYLECLDFVRMSELVSGGDEIKSHAAKATEAACAKALAEFIRNIEGRLL